MRNFPAIGFPKASRQFYNRMADFSHPKADDGLTLSHPDKEIREFWIVDIVIRFDQLNSRV